MSSIEDLRYHNLKDALLLLAAREDSRVRRDDLIKDYGETITNLALHADAAKYSKLVFYLMNEVQIDLAIRALRPRKRKYKNKIELQGELKGTAALLQILSTRKALPIKEARKILLEVLG